MAITKKKTSQKTILIGLAVAMIFVLVGVFVLSYSMETLDKQAEQLGAQENPVYNPPFPEYTIPGIDSVWGALLIGIAGTLLLFVTSLGVAKLMHKKKGNQL
jgi:protein-S-isoprenylcysteine O-methyltransferase Ste14